MNEHWNYKMKRSKIQTQVLIIEGEYGLQNGALGQN